MTEVPAETPVTIRLAEPTVATDEVTLLHVPPGVTSDKVIVLLIHVVTGPVMACGMGLTVTVIVAVGQVVTE